MRSSTSSPGVWSTGCVYTKLLTLPLAVLRKRFRGQPGPRCQWRILFPESGRGVRRRSRSEYPAGSNHVPTGLSPDFYPSTADDQERRRCCSSAEDDVNGTLPRTGPGLCQPTDVPCSGRRRSNARLLRCGPGLNLLRRASGSAWERASPDLYRVYSKPCGASRS